MKPSGPAATRLGRKMYTAAPCRARSAQVPQTPGVFLPTDTHGDGGKKSHKNVQTTGNMLATLRGIDRGSCKNRLV